ncbi:MAG: hypothetical protein FWE37_02270 [Spirochaetaceae bacterium]|nr:hypothetical protein [Spirochaetaceae bacterium]
MPQQKKDIKVIWRSLRGKEVYHKYTLKYRKILELGDAPSSDETLLSPKGIPFAKWDNQENCWVTDEEAQEKQRVEEELIKLREEAINAMLLQSPEYISKVRELIV